MSVTIVSGRRVPGAYNPIGTPYPLDEITVLATGNNQFRDSYIIFERAISGTSNFETVGRYPFVINGYTEHREKITDSNTYVYRVSQYRYGQITEPSDPFLPTDTPPTSSTGGGTTLARSAVNFTTATAASGSIVTGSVSLGKSFILLTVSSSVPNRVRFYASQSYRDADITRAIGSDPSGEHGLILDLVASGTETFNIFDLSPQPLGADKSPGQAGTIHYASTNMTTASLAIVYSVTRIALES